MEKGGAASLTTPRRPGTAGLFATMMPEGASPPGAAKQGVSRCRVRGRRRSARAVPVRAQAGQSRRHRCSAPSPGARRTVRRVRGQPRRCAHPCARTGAGARKVAATPHRCALGGVDRLALEFGPASAVPWTIQPVFNAQGASKVVSDHPPPGGSSVLVFLDCECDGHDTYLWRQWESTSPVRSGSSAAIPSVSSARARSATVRRAKVLDNRRLPK